MHHNLSHIQASMCILTDGRVISLRIENVFGEDDILVLIYENKLFGLEL